MDPPEEFWCALDNQLRPKLTNYVSMLLWQVLKRHENPGYAEDIVSETFIAAYEKFGTFNPERGPLYPWILQIAKNKTYDLLRKHRELKSERSFDESQAGLQALAQEPEFLYERDSTPTPKTLALRKALRKLSRYDQELLICRLGNTLDYEELERYFNFSVKRATLRVHVNRALARLRRQLAKEPEFREFYESSGQEN